MEKQRISGIRACVFDAYGTLFDVHSAVGKHKQRLGSAAEAISMTWRTKQLEYTWLRSLMKRHADFWQVTRDALEYAAERHGLDDPALEDDLMAAYLELDCYPEAPKALSELKQRGLERAILSNGTPEMLQRAVEHSGLDALITKIFSVETVGIFKPDSRVYQMAVDELNVAPQEIIFLSSNAWDAAGAAAFGFRVAWINRFNQQPERLPGKPDVEIRTLTDLLDAVE